MGLVKRQGFSKQPAPTSGRPDREVNEEHPAGLDQSNPVDTATANFATDPVGYAASSTSATNADGSVTIDKVALNPHARVALRKFSTRSGSDSGGGENVDESSKGRASDHLGQTAKWNKRKRKSGRETKNAP